MEPEFDAEANVEHEQTRMGGMLMREQRFVEELKTLVTKYEKIMVFTVSGSVPATCSVFLVELLRRELDGVMNGMIVIADLLLFLAILFNLAAWLCCQEWGSEVVSNEVQEMLAMHQAASTEGQFQERLWAVSSRYMILVCLETTYLLCSLLGFTFLMVGVVLLPLYLFWILLGLAFLWSVVVIIYGIVRLYQAYGSYCSLSKCLSRI